MITTRSYLIAASISFLPYLALSWGYMQVVDGDVSDFWVGLGGLVAARTFFAVVELIGDALAWRLYTKHLVVADQVARLRAAKFPRRRYRHDDFLNHLARIDGELECDEATRRAARDMYISLRICEENGMFLGMRMHSAMDAAFDAYSPPSDAPALGA